MRSIHRRANRAACVALRRRRKRGEAASADPSPEPRTLSRVVFVDSYADAVAWGRKALAVAKSEGRTATIASLQAALKAIDAPFWSVNPILRRFGGITAAAYLRDVVTQRPIEVPSDAVFERSEMVQLGPTTTANAVPGFDWRASWQTLSGSFVERTRAQRSECYRTVKIDTRGDEAVCVLVLGDMHIGSPSTDYPRLDRIASLLTEPHLGVYGVFVGDVVDAMIWPGVRYEGRASPISVHKEVLTAVGWMREASSAGRLIGGVCGNHDLVSEKLAGLSHFALAMEQLTVPFAKNELLVDVQVGSETYKWEIRHSVRNSGGATLNRANGIQRHQLFNHRDTEVACCGHVHKSGVSEDTRHGRKRFGIQVGAYKVSDLDDYAVENGFERGENEPDYGVLLWANRHQVEVMKTDRAIEWIRAASARGTCSRRTAPESSATSRSGGSRSRSEEPRRSSLSGAKARRDGGISRRTKTETRARSSKASRIRSGKRGGQTSS